MDGSAGAPVSACGQSLRLYFRHTVKDFGKQFAGRRHDLGIA
jgi:hypothetical protein